MFGSVIKSFEIIRPTLKRRKIVVQFRSVANDSHGLKYILLGGGGGDGR